MAILNKINELVLPFFTVYSTPKVVQVENKKIGVLYRIIQLLIFAYVLGFMIIYEKGYQLSSSIESAVVTKIKGTTKINLTVDDPGLNPNFDKNNLKFYNRVWDVQDIVYPPKESNGFFLSTNLIITKNQSLGSCPNESDLKGSKCNKEHEPVECLSKQSVHSDGLNTGKCIESSYLNATVCEIKGWCPTEKNILPLKNNEPLFKDVLNFTVLIKETIRFPLFNILKRNIDEKDNNKLRGCNFHPSDSPRCPIFKIGDILTYAGVKFEDISKYGGVIAIQIDWNCDLDWDLNYCFPTYKFTRVDLKDTVVSPGYNFRYSRYNSLNDVEKRDLFKAYGIRFEILTSGEGRKFNIVPLALNIGSGIGLLALATLVCDFVLLYFTPAKEIYNKKKYLYVHEELTKVKPKLSEITDSSIE